MTARPSGAPSQNHVSSITVVDTVLKTPFAQEGNRATGAAYVEVVGGGLSLPEYDYVSMALSGGNTTETYVFKIGGSGGTTVATVVIVYTDSTRAVLSTVTRT